MTLDYDTANRAAELVELLTSNGQDYNDWSKLNEIENICKKSTEYIERVHMLLLHQLKEKHSEVRFSALRVYDFLFKKFQHFRKLVIDDFSIFLKLTINTDINKPLPPPKKFAKELEIMSVKYIKEWKDEFGSDFIDEFDFVFKYLNKYKKIDFQTMTVLSFDEARRIEDRECRQKYINERKIKLIQSELKELEPEIVIAIKSLESCLELLIPTPEQFAIPEVEQIINKDSFIQKKTNESFNIAPECFDKELNLRENGIIYPEHSVTVTLKSGFQKRVKKTEDNRDVIESANEQTKLITEKYLPKVKQWLQDVAKISNNEVLLKKIIEMKQYIIDLIKRENKIIYYGESDNSNDDDSDMEEVLPSTKIADELLTQYVLNNSTFSSATTSSQQNLSNEIKKKSLDVPKLPFDVDLYHWEDENIAAPRVLPTNTEGYHFWSSNSVMDTDGDGIIQPGGPSNLRTRVIEFTGKFERVERQCRAPLPSGKLCAREDRIKCPFHGVIVARDESGRPINPKDEIELQKNKVPDWQDPQLLRDIQRETGVNLTMPKKGSRKKKEKYPKLTDFKKEQNTPRARLEKKIFKKSSVKKVAKIMDSMDQRKFRDKFGDQFNYVHDTA
ncbi:UV-stimulated scaffold protein A-like [Daktulosphaira vitifoliae]|uniref:UV-stimulated scaffold protein A-like n=1 Tax=Daktulosphaira vitifoliae TaxID=58002 RepID=UPI0021AA7997|nr:UV-stimulated scaffold protein A-like [Daktulosphaira vitifoliae]